MNCWNGWVAETLIGCNSARFPLRSDVEAHLTVTSPVTLGESIA